MLFMAPNSTLLCKTNRSNDQTRKSLKKMFAELWSQGTRLEGGQTISIHGQQDLAKTRVSASCAVCCLHLHADQPLFNSQRQILLLPKVLTSENWGTEGVRNSFSVIQLVSGPVDIISVFVSVKTGAFSQVEESKLDCVRGGSKHGHIEILHMHIQVKPGIPKEK